MSLFDKIFDSFDPEKDTALKEKVYKKNSFDKRFWTLIFSVLSIHKGFWPKNLEYTVITFPTEKIYRPKRWTLQFSVFSGKIWFSSKSIIFCNLSLFRPKFWTLLFFNSRPKIFFSQIFWTQPFLLLDSNPQTD